MVKPSFTEVPMSPECPTGQSGHKKSTVATINTLCRLYNSHLLGIFLSWHIYTWEMLILKANNMNRDHAVVLDRQREFKGTMQRITVSQQMKHWYHCKKVPMQCKEKVQTIWFYFPWPKLFWPSLSGGRAYQYGYQCGKIERIYHYGSENKHNLLSPWKRNIHLNYSILP